jgi:hypothetical protein
MKIAVLSESPADEAAIRVLVEGVLGRPTQTIAFPPLRTRGWQGALGALPAVLRYLHYATDADGFVAVVDSDHSPVHQPSHEQSGSEGEACRLCKLRGLVARVQRQLRDRAGRPPIKTAFGLTAPSIEAWFRAGIDPRVSEAAWVLGLQSGSFPYTKLRLKEDVYGSDRLSIAVKTERGIVEARRLALDLNTFEKLFPNGFGALARAIRSW